MTVTRLRATLLAPLAAITLAGCGLNSVPTAEENVNARFADLQADYQRRSDLIGNLVETVKAAAAQESTVLIGISEARARATSTTLSPADLSDPAKVQAFDRAQAQVGVAVRPLLGPMIQERYRNCFAQEFLVVAGPIGRHREPHQRLAPRL